MNRNRWVMLAPSSSESCDCAGQEQRELCIHHMELGYDQVLWDDENLSGNHHLHKDQRKEEFFKREFQSAERISRECRRKAGAQDAKEDHYQCVLVKNQEVVGIPDLNKVFKMPTVPREDVERIDGYGLASALKCGEHHPRKGCDHDQRTEYQEQVNRSGSQSLFSSPSHRITSYNWFFRCC